MLAEYGRVGSGCSVLQSLPTRRVVQHHATGTHLALLHQHGITLSALDLPTLSQNMYCSSTQRLCTHFSIMLLCFAKHASVGYPSAQQVPTGLRIISVAWLRMLCCSCFWWPGLRITWGCRSRYLKASVLRLLMVEQGIRVP